MCKTFDSYSASINQEFGISSLILYNKILEQPVRVVMSVVNNTSIDESRGSIKIN